VNDVAGPIDSFYADLSALIDEGFFNIAGPMGVVFRFMIVIGILWMAIRWFTTESPVLYPALRRIAAVSVILWFALNWPWYTEAFVGSLSRIGVQVGTGDGYTGYDLVDVNRPSSFGEHAFTTAFRLYDYALSLQGDGWFPGVGFLVKGAMLLLTSLIVFCCGAAVIILILTYMVLFKVGTVVVFVLLPFLLSDQTKWMCERALGWMVSCGVRFMVLSMVIGFLYAVAQRTIGDLGDGVTSVGGLFQVLLFNLLLIVFIAIANKFAGEIAGGAASLSVGGLVGSAASSASGMRETVRTTSRVAAATGKGAAVAVLAGAAGAAFAGGKAKSAAGGAARWVDGRRRAAGGAGASGTVSASALAVRPVASRMRPPANDIVGAEWVTVTPAPPPRLSPTSARRALPS
jgi:type IV secretion system protein TrbL